MALFDIDDVNPIAFKTGFTDVNLYLGGGFRKNALHILASRPGMGKTSLLSCFATHAGIYHQKSVLFISMQRSENELASIFIGQEAGLNVRAILSNDGLSLDDTKFFNEACERLKSADIEIIARSFDSESLSKTIADKFESKQYDLVIIDALNNIKASPGQDIREEISRVCKSLKGFALDFETPFIASQGIIRQVEARVNKRPFLSELAECDISSSIADVVMILYREEYYNPDSHDKNTAEIAFVKNSMGPTGPMRLYFEASIQKFGNLLVV